jgi:hypothetical protein
MIDYTGLEWEAWHLGFDHAGHSEEDWQRDGLPFFDGLCISGRGKVAPEALRGALREGYIAGRARIAREVAA